MTDYKSMYFDIVDASGGENLQTLHFNFNIKCFFTEVFLRQNDKTLQIII